MGAGSSHLAPRSAAYQASSLGLNTTQVQTNGLSQWGTLAAPTLPKFLTNNPLPNGFPWSTFDAETNYYELMPDTGVIRSYDFTISRGVIAPDGYQKQVMLVNGAFPGPAIEANWGDTIQVTLHNNITGPEEGTALHWHGFLQRGTPWEDGVPAVTQCPVAPGKSFTYSFRPQLYGTTWYHSHYSAQYAGGIFGPIVIYGPSFSSYDIDLGPVMISDWYHEDYFSLVQKTMEKNGKQFPSDNNLINGKMNFDCSTLPPSDKTPCFNNAGVSKFKFQRGKKHRLRLVNTGAEAFQRFSIDGHKMTVIANDFVMLQPYETDTVTLAVGQRADVVVEANGDGNAFWMRTHVGGRSCAYSLQPSALAAIYYDGADESQKPTSQAVNGWDDASCSDADLNTTNPILLVPAQKPDVEKTIEIDFYKNETGFDLWHMNGSAFRGNYNSPTLLLGKLHNMTALQTPEWNVINLEQANMVRVVVKNKFFADHPMHLHGFNMQVLHVGTGDWDGTIVRPLNPQRRDVIMVPGKGHLVIQFEAGKNPGVWPFHCHIAWHVSAGLFVQFLANEDAVTRLPIPQTVAQTCREWGDWTNTNIPEQIDSGL